MKITHCPVYDHIVGSVSLSKEVIGCFVWLGGFSLTYCGRVLTGWGHANLEDERKLFKFQLIWLHKNLQERYAVFYLKHK